MGNFRYKAFISYSHKDREYAKWLHRKLETYTLPNHLTNIQTDRGRAPRNLKPVFRDREELSVGHNLGEKIESALRATENLIIICSPNAAASHWVNQEILFFKRHNRDARIFSVIVDGYPFAQNPEEECFPEALRFEVDQSGALTNQPAEPLAADIRDTGDGRRLGLLKLISGIVGVGVNDLVQRDLQRARKRVIAITATASAIILLMASLTWTAIDARQEAEQRRNDAEGQIEFMLTDLKEELEGVGRLDALKKVGDRAAQYYDNYPISDHSDDALARRARVFHFIGELQDKYGDLGAAEKYFDSAYAISSNLIEELPNNPNIVFVHAQSLFWMSYPQVMRENYDKAEMFARGYVKYAEKLSELEPDNVRSFREIAYAQSNLGVLLHFKGLSEAGLTSYKASIPSYEQIVALLPNELSAYTDLANAYAWMGTIALALEDHQEAKRYRLKQIDVYQASMREHPNNYELLEYFTTAQLGLARVELRAGQLDNALETVHLAQLNAEKLLHRDRTNQEWVDIMSKLNGLEIELTNREAAGSGEE